MAHEDRTHFRNKQLVRKAKLHQKVLRPLAAWLDRKGPNWLLVNGLYLLLVAIAAVLTVLHFYSFVLVLPYLILGIVFVSVGLSWALQKGKQ